MSRAGTLVIPPIVLDRQVSTALYRQLAAQLATAIRHGTLDGARLPSTRVLARLLGVSRNTVLAAYDELAAGGLIAARHGSGTRVPHAGRSVPAPFAPLRVLRDAQYPSRSLGISDADGTPIYLTY